MDDDLIPAADMKNLFPGTTDQTWAQMRHKGNGPVYVKLCGKVYYRQADIDAWIGANRYARTDQPVKA